MEHLVRFVLISPRQLWAVLAVSLVASSAMTAVWFYSAPWLFAIDPEIGGLDVQFVVTVEIALGAGLFVAGVALVIFARWYTRIIDRL